MYEDLRSALAASDWARALPLALDAWREHRVPVLADLVDAIAARCAIKPPVDRKHLHAWWMEHATPYDPLAVHALAATFAIRGRAVRFRDVLKRWPSNRVIAAVSASLPSWWIPWSSAPNNHLDRLAAMAAWPDDPRTSAMLIHVATMADPGLTNAGALAVVGVLADWLEHLRDRRIVPALSARIDEPFDGERSARLRSTAAALDGMPPDFSAHAHAIAELTALVPRPPPQRDLAPLWAEVAAHPDEVGPRLILGDALVEAGDLRGDVIVLSCNAKRPHRPLRGANRERSDGRVRTITRLEWERWLGDLALVLARRGCEMRNGMLEVVQVGRGETPAWAWSKVRGHRELACVHTVRPGHVAPANYASFIAALPRVPRTLGITRHEQVPALADAFPHLGVGTLEFDQVSDRQPAWPLPPLAQTFDALERIVPALDEIAFMGVVNRDELAQLAGRLPQMFPALRRIRIRTSLVTSAHVQNLPLVELVP